MVAIRKLTMHKNKFSILSIISAALFLFSVLAPSALSALSKEQKRIFEKNSLYYDLACGSVDADSSTSSGTGAPDGASFPNLDPAAMAKGIDKYMQQTNSGGRLNGLGETIVAGAKNSNVSPFLIVAIAEKESGLGDPNFGDGFNVREANNSFGRSATSSQPHVQGAKLWYKWSSVKASVDHTAAENKNASGGGDIAAYIRNVYPEELKEDDFDALFKRYAPEFENDTQGYIKTVKSGLDKMIALTEAEGGSPSASGDTASISKVYMLGDSITEGASQKLKASFKKAGITPYINASTSRSITGGGQTGDKLSGIKAVEKDKDRIKESGAIIIALGTNQNSNFGNSMKNLINKVKAEAKNNVPVYWVNVFSEVPGKNSINNTINNVSGKEGVQVIDTLDKNIEVGPDNIHPTTAGQKNFAAAVSEKVISEAATQDTEAEEQQPGNCACSESGGSGSAALTGKTNAEKAYNYLIDKGLSPKAASAVVGNLMLESGGNTENIDPKITNSIGAHGIAQWYQGRRTALQQFAAKKGTNENDFRTQLDFLWYEITESGNYDEMYKILKTSDNLAYMAVQWEVLFEISGVLGTRVENAIKIFEKYGGGNSSGSSTTESSSSSGCESASSNGGEAFSGSAQEAAKSLLSNKGVQILDDRALIQAIADGRDSPVSGNLVIMLAGLAQNHTFSISSLYRGPCSGSNHCTGHAVDINPTIDGQTISYSGNNPKIQAFIDDAAKILGSNCENGVPNQQYVAKTKANGSKCEVFLDIGTGPHVHLAVRS